MKKRQMRIAIVLITALCFSVLITNICGIWSYANFFADPEGQVLVEEGKVLLGQQNVLAAKAKFQEAIALDFLNQEAHFYMAVTRIMAVYEESVAHPTGLDSIREIAELAGISFATFGFYNSEYTTPDELASSTPNTGDVLAFIRDRVLTEVDAAIVNLQQVTDVDFASTLQPSAVRTSGSNFVIDYPDVLLLKAFLYASKASLEYLLAYDLNISPPALLNGTLDEMLKFKDVLNGNPVLLKPVEPARLASAKTALINCIDTHGDAIPYVQSRPTATNHLFVLDVPEFELTNELIQVEFPGSLFVDLGNSGIWKNDWSAWSKLAPENPESIVASGAILYADLGSYGIWKHNGIAWSKLAPENPEEIVASDTTLYADLGSYGIWKYNGTTWTQLAPENPENIIVSGSMLYADLGAYGIWENNGSGWIQLAPENPEKMAVSGYALYADLGSFGLWEFNGIGWSKLAPENPENIVASNSVLYADFGVLGLWKYRNNAWNKLAPENPENIIASGSALYSDFGTLGIWRYVNDTWNKLAPENPENMVVSKGIDNVLQTLEEVKASLQAGTYEFVLSMPDVSANERTFNFSKIFDFGTPLDIREKLFDAQGNIFISDATIGGVVPLGIGVFFETLLPQVNQGSDNVDPLNIAASRSGSGFTPNNHAVLYQRSPTGAVTNLGTVATDAIGRFDIVYRPGTSLSEGMYYWWAIDSQTSVKSNEERFITCAHKWVQKMDGWVSSSPAVAIDGTVYIASFDGLIKAINPDGSLKWSYATGAWIFWSSPAVADDGTVFIGSDDYKLYAINPDGSLKWTYPTGGGIQSSPAIDADGTVYVGSSDGNLYAINPNGTLKWTYTIGWTYCGSPVIGTDGTVYIGTDKLFALNPNGTLKWAYISGGQADSSPAVRADGTIYVGFNENFYAIASDGTLKWFFETDGYTASSPAIETDGTVYVGSGGYLYALYSFSSGLASSAWPMRGHDTRHTGRAP